jgi:hypothetical protein
MTMDPVLRTSWDTERPTTGLDRGRPWSMSLYNEMSDMGDSGPWLDSWEGRRTGAVGGMSRVLEVNLLGVAGGGGALRGVSSLSPSNRSLYLIAMARIWSISSDSRLFSTFFVSEMSCRGIICVRSIRLQLPQERVLSLGYVMNSEDLWRWLSPVCSCFRDPHAKNRVQKRLHGGLFVPFSASPIS